MDKLLIQMSLLVLYYNLARRKSKKGLSLSLRDTGVYTRCLRHKQVNHMVCVHQLRSLV
jgi:hypothetical protein